MPNFIVDISQTGKRIDHVLVDLISISRSQIQKLIKSGIITLNGSSCKMHTVLKTGDKIFYPNISKTSAHKKQISPLLKILYEDDDVVVINKQAGLLVHRSNETDGRPNVADIILQTHKKIKQVGENPLRPGIVHRLDKAVSGIMVIAKTQTMFENLKLQFQNHSVEKRYWALVYGKLPKDHDVISSKISRSKSQGRMVARTGEQEGKEAITEWDVKDRFKNATLVDVQIHTGRTHQIRVHFFSIGHPVVGDHLYRIASMRHVREMNFDRLFLHASALTIHLADGKPKTFTAPLPKELKQILDVLPKK